MYEYNYFIIIINVQYFRLHVTNAKVNELLPQDAWHWWSYKYSCRHTTALNCLSAPSTFWLDFAKCIVLLHNVKIPINSVELGFGDVEGGPYADVPQTRVSKLEEVAENFRISKMQSVAGPALSATAQNSEGGTYYMYTNIRNTRTHAYHRSKCRNLKQRSFTYTHQH